MQLICPCCQTAFPIEAGINDVAARNAIKRAFSLSPLGELLLAYVQLFRSPKRVLSIAKLVKVLDEIIPLIQTGRIEHRGRIWAAPLNNWRSALEEMLDRREKLTLPLKNHSYLFTIIAGFADKAEGNLETQTEARKVGGASRRQQAEEPKSKAMPQEVKDKLNQFLNKTVT